MRSDVLRSGWFRYRAVAHPSWTMTVRRTGTAAVSTVSRVFAFQALLPALQTGLRQDSKAQADQVRTYSPDVVIADVAYAGRVRRRRRCGNRRCPSPTAG